MQYSGIGMYGVCGVCIVFTIKKKMDFQFPISNKFPFFPSGLGLDRLFK